MAIYHLTAKIVSRGKGDSSVAAATYQSRSRMIDERTGELHNYSRNADDVLFAGLYAPKDAPDWARDRTSLWNHVEGFGKRKDAQLARGFDIALPHELTPEQCRWAVQDWVRENFTRKGLIADVAIHRPGADGDERNIHAHVLVAMRKLDGAEFAAKKERAASFAERTDELEVWRESWERIGNRHLERHGFAPTLDCRSFEDRGIERVPGLHMGKTATALERGGEPTDRGDLNREIEAHNAALRDRAAQEIEAVKAEADRAAARQQAAIERAAEAADREARAAARGQKDDIRGPDRQDARPPPEPAAEMEKHGAAAEPALAPQQPAAEPGHDLHSPESIGSRMLGGIGKALMSFIEQLADFLAPPPPPTSDQAERMARSAEEQQEAHARQTAQAERDAAQHWLIAEAQRQAAREREEEERFRRTMRDAARDDRDQGYERERERER